MVSGTAENRVGKMAGGIAMFTALLVMQLVSRVTGPELLLTDVMAFIAMREISPGNGWLANFLWEGNARVRIVVALALMFILVGAALGRWAGSRQGTPGTFTMQAGAILLFVTYTILYVSGSSIVRFYPQEVLVTLALSSLVWVFLTNWLITGPDERVRWGVAGALAVVAVGVVTYDMSSWL